MSSCTTMESIRPRIPDIVSGSTSAAQPARCWFHSEVVPVAHAASVGSTTHAGAVGIDEGGERPTECR